MVPVFIFVILRGVTMQRPRYFAKLSAAYLRHSGPLLFIDQLIYYSRPTNNENMDGWSGPSRGQMPAGSWNNLLPRQCLVYKDVAGVSCNRTVSFRPVDNPTGTRMHREWAASLSASPVLG